MTYEQLVKSIDDNLEEFKRQQLDNRATSVNVFYAMTLKTESKTITTITGSKNLTETITANRRGDFEMRKEAWLTLNRLRLLLAIKECPRITQILDSRAIQAVEVRINELTDLHKIFADELDTINDREDERLENLALYINEETLTKVKQTLNDTFEKIVMGEALVHIKLTPQCFEVIKNNILAMEDQLDNMRTGT